MTVSHPPYFQMTKEALQGLNEKNGSSSYAIGKFMKDNYKPILPTNFRKILGVHIKNLIGKGKLIKIKGSYKLSKASKKKKAWTSKKSASAAASTKKAAKSVKKTKNAAGVKAKQTKSIKSFVAKRAKKEA
ncbi:hypothetical protein SAY86_032170 [Trapa natans]|uniref:H15 domain-containing protein n=1 Tax=Trapa natans TaxID=22666 RepID=A0AAN7LT46_TRANT|nr:hypothetical protein SAY86_032170 [Trapa natans]